ncbi:MAG: MoaD/ThiS family protein [Acidimicrobiales bacterium]
MATLRLFASVRVAAGTGRAQFDAATVGAVIEAAITEYGPAFAEQVQQCRVWLDGEPAEWSEPVSAGSEVALLPPVSGG